MQIQNTQISTPKSHILKAFSSSLEDYINIYGVASLVQQTELLPINELISNKKVTSFILEGELRGFIKCIYQEDITLKQSLLNEAFNILIGNILTKLEDHHIFCAISAPIERDYNTSMKEFNFTFKYNLENGESSHPIQFNFYFDSKLVL